MNYGWIIGWHSMVPMVFMMPVILETVGGQSMVPRAMYTMGAMAASIHHTML